MRLLNSGKNLTSLCDCNDLAPYVELSPMSDLMGILGFQEETTKCECIWVGFIGR